MNSSRAKENNSYRECCAAWCRVLGSTGEQKLSTRHHGNADGKFQIFGIKGEEEESERKAGVHKEAGRRQSRVDIP